MGSLNFNPFGGNWFKKPKTPLQLIHPNGLTGSFKPRLQNPNFSSISSIFGFNKPVIEPPPKDEGPGKNTQLLERYFQEEEARPDYRNNPVVDQVLNEDPLFEKKKEPTQEELEENEKWWSEFRGSPVVKFLVEAEELADKLHEKEMKENAKPLRESDGKIWDSLPNVIGLDGRPMPRKAMDYDTAYMKFWDFMKEFLFGSWGFKNRPYPSGRPIDIVQAIGHKQLEFRYYDFIMKSGGFYYKDRLGRTRGPMELVQLRTAWGAGIIDKNTFVWGEDMDEWAPICMIYGMERAVANWDAKFTATLTSFLHKIQKGKSPWAPLKGHKDLTYKEAQQEAYESKKRDLAVLEANDGIWPGVRIPSHSLFLWASGTELTSILEDDHMPNKFIPKEMRKELQKIIPGLRPWEVLSVEQAMDQITYNKDWYREPLGIYMTGPPYYEEATFADESWGNGFVTFWHRRAARKREFFEERVPGYRKFLITAFVDGVISTGRLRFQHALSKIAKERKEWAEILNLPKKP